MNKALFLDRDGILNHVILRENVVSSPRSFADFCIITEAIKLAQQAKSRGYFCIVITNQPDVARGLLPLATLHRMHQSLQRHMPLDAIETCISSDDMDPRRKPNPKMLLDTGSLHRIDFNRSFFVGDSRKDILAGRKAGIPTILLETGYNTETHGSADYNCNTWNEIAEVIKPV